MRRPPFILSPEPLSAGLHLAREVNPPHSTHSRMREGERERAEGEGEWGRENEKMMNKQTNKQMSVWMCAREVPCAVVLLGTVPYSTCF